MWPSTFCAIPSLCNPPGRKLVELRIFPHVMNSTVAAVLDGPVYAPIYLQSRYGRIDTGIQIRCPLTSRYAAYNLLRRAPAIHIKQGLNSFVEILARHLRRYNVSGFLYRQSPHSLPMLPLIGSASPLPSLPPHLCAHSPRCKSKTDVRNDISPRQHPPRESIPPPADGTNCCAQ